MQPMILTPNQCLDLAAILAHHANGGGQSAALYCTGGGKTELALAFTAKALVDSLQFPALRYTHVIFAAPTEETRDAFVAKSFEIAGEQYTTRPIYTNQDAPVKGGAEGYLALSDPGFELRVTHLLLGRSVEALKTVVHDNRAALKGRFLVVDEAHQAGKGRVGVVPTRMAELIAVWIEGGGDVMYLSATPDLRSDGAEVFCKDEVFCVYQPMSKQMACGQAPETLITEPILVSGEGVSDDEDACIPVDPKEVADKIAEHIECDQRPKAIIRLKNQGNSAKHLNIILECASSLTRKGVRVLIASGSHVSNPALAAMNAAILNEIRKRRPNETIETIADVLRHENSCRYEESCVDVIIGIQSVLQGFNWKLCSHVYFIGIPLVLLPAVQGTGRSMRFRMHIVGYPSQWINASKIVLLTAGDLEGVKEATYRHLLRIVCYLSRFQHWTVLGAMHSAFENIPFATPDEKELKRRAVSKLDIPDTKVAEIRLLLISARKLFDDCVQSHHKHTYHSIANITFALAQRQNTNITLAEILLVVVTENRAARALLQRRVGSKLDAGVEVTEAIQEGLAEVIEEMSGQDYEPSPASHMISSVLQQISMDAKKIDDLAARVEALFTEEGLVEDDKAADPFTATVKRLRERAGTS